MIVSFTETKNENLTAERVQGALGVKTKLALVSVSGEASGIVGGNSTLSYQNVSIKVIGDLPIPETGLPTSFETVKPYLENIPTALSEYNGGKGKVQFFGLARLIHFRQGNGSESLIQVFSEQLSGVVVSDFMRTFQQINDHEQYLAHLADTSHKEYAPQAMAETVKSHKSSFDKLKKKFRRDVKYELLQMRSVASSELNDNTPSIESENEIKVAMLKSNFPKLTHRHFLYENLKKAGVPYFGRNTHLSEYLHQHRYFFCLLIPADDVEKSLEFIRQYQFFLNEVVGRKVAVDCSFNQIGCSMYNSTDGRIIEYNDLNVVDADVKKSVEENRAHPDIARQNENQYLL